MADKSSKFSHDGRDELDRDLDGTDERGRTPGRDKAPRGPEPPRTKTGPFAAPKFGSAGSGGAELEPGPERP